MADSSYSQCVTHNSPTCENGAFAKQLVRKSS